MEIIIKHEYASGKELKEIVKTVSEVEKEYSCNCTLILKHFKNNQVFHENENSEIKGISQALQSTVYDTLQAFDKK